MIEVKKVALGVFVAAIAGTSVAAQEFVQFGEAGGWKVFTDTSNNTCLIETQREGLIVQMGILNSGLGYVGAFTQEESAASAESGTQLIIDIDGNLYYADENVMHGNSQGFSGAYIKADNTAFISDVANGQTMKVVDESRTFTLDLTGTKAAMTMGRECLAAQG